MFEKELALAKEVAKEAGDILLENFRKIEQVTEKSTNNFVTNVDLASEKHILSRLNEAFPGYNVFSEEIGKQENGSSYRWIIDPLDGTHSFIASLPTFCVSIALEYEGEIVLGVVYVPFTQETFWAQKGKGAFINDKRISVSQQKDIHKAILFAGGSFRDPHTHKYPDDFSRLSRQVRGIRIPGTSALENCYVAAGRGDIAVDTVHYYDFAAASLIVKEAGGSITQVDGKPLSADSRYIVSTNGILHSEVLSTLTGD